MRYREGARAQRGRRTSYFSEGQNQAKTAVLGLFSPQLAGAASPLYHRFWRKMDKNSGEIFFPGGKSWLCRLEKSDLDKIRSRPNIATRRDIVDLQQFELFQKINKTYSVAL